MFWFVIWCIVGFIAYTLISENNIKTAKDFENFTDMPTILFYVFYALAWFNPIMIIGRIFHWLTNERGK